MYTGHWQSRCYYFLIGNLTSTSVMSVRCSSEIVLRRWRAWIHDMLPPPSWASSKGEHLDRSLRHSYCDLFNLWGGPDNIHNGVFCRGDFSVKFDHESSNSTSTFQLLQEACFQMCRNSHRIMQKKGNTAKQSEQHLYQRFVYSRFMWGKCKWKSANVLSEKQFERTGMPK